MSTPTPPDGYIAPALDLPSFNCPHCGARTQQDWSELGYARSDGDHLHWVSMERVRDFGSPSWTDNWNGAKCFSCDKWSVWYEGVMVYPPARIGAVASADMPAEVRALHMEAAQVGVVSRRAAAALARAAVERLLKTLDPDAPAKAKLADYIERVRPRVSAPLGQLLDVVRVTGNQALHVDNQPPELVLLVLDSNVGPGVLETLLETANDLVDELITRPKRALELWEKLPEGVKAQLPAPEGSTPSEDCNGS